MRTLSNDRSFWLRNLVRYVAVASVLLAGLAQSPKASPAGLAPSESLSLEPWWQAPDDISDLVPPVPDTTYGVELVTKRQIAHREGNLLPESPRRGSLPCRSAAERLPRQSDKRKMDPTHVSSASAAGVPGDRDKSRLSFETSHYCARFAVLCQFLGEA